MAHSIAKNHPAVLRHRHFATPLGWVSTAAVQVVLELIAFEGVAAAAEHLEVLRHGLAALRPRHDVVALHLPIIEMPVADGADTFLPLVGRALVVVIEHAEVQFLATRAA